MTSIILRKRRHDISYVAGYYPPHLGGLENVAKSVAELLATRHDVRVITTRCGSQGAPSREIRAGVRVRRFAGFSFAHTPFSVGMALRLLTVGRRSIVHVHVAHAFVPEVVLLTSVLRRGRYVAHFHADVASSGRFGVLLESYKRLALGPCLRRAAAVIALTDEQAAFLTAAYRVDRDRITVIPNGVDRVFFELSDGARTRGDRRQLRLLYVGRLQPGKGLSRLVESLTHVSSEVELVIVGDGVLRDETADLVQQLGLTNVRMVGSVFGPELLRWYEWADALVMPSDREGMPLVVLEAMAAGLAVIGTDAPGTREVVGGVGLLTELNPASVGAAIDKVATDRELLSELSRNSIERSQEFRWDAAAVELERVYDTVAIE